MQERSLPTGLRVNDISDKKIIESQYIGSYEIINFVESLFHISQENVGTIALFLPCDHEDFEPFDHFFAFFTPFLRIMLRFLSGDF